MIALDPQILDEVEVLLWTRLYIQERTHLCTILVDRTLNSPQSHQIYVAMAAANVGQST